MSLTANQVWRDFNTAGVPASGDHEPVKSEIRQWASRLEAAAGIIVKDTLSQLQAVTPAAETYGGIVLDDATASNNGYYYRSGGAWVKGRGFPDTFARITLGGTANAQTGTVDSGVNPSDIEVFFGVVTTANTGPMTLSISGETARDVVNAAGNALSAGEWTGVVLFFPNDDGDYQLLIDAGAAAAAAQSATDADADADRSEAARDATLAALSSVFAPKATVAAAIADAPSVDPEYYDIAYYDTSYTTGSGTKYRKRAGDPGHAGAFQNANGTWYEIDDRVIRPEMFGAIGDGDGAGGGTDDAAAIQNALDVADGRKCDLDGSKIYKCLSALRMPSNTTLRFNGAKLDFSLLTATNDDFSSDIKLCLYAKGDGRGVSSALASNADVAAYTVAVADGSIFAAGDWVQITAENFISYDGSTEVKTGEIAQVQSVALNDVTLRTPLLRGYTTANTATLHKVSFVENVHLDRPAIIGSDTENDKMEAIRLLWVKGFSVKDASVENVDLRATHLANSIIGDVDGGYIDGVRYTGTGQLFYGLTLNNSTQWVTIRGVKAQEVRHLYVNSSSSLDYGEPLFITVDDCHLWNAMSGGAFSSYAYEHHGFGRFITISNCTANGCHSGVRIEGPDIRVANCTFRNVRFNGISIETGNLKDIQISDCRVSFQTGESTSTRAALGIAVSGGVAIENIVVDGLQVDRFFDVTNGACYGVRVGPATSARNIVIGDVTLFAALAASVDDYGFYIEAPEVTIRAPKIHNYPSAIFIAATADNAHIVSPEIYNDVIPAASNAIQINAHDVVVRSPTLRNIYRAIYIDTGVTGAVVTHKVAKGITTTDTDNGTASVITSGLTT